MVRLFQTIDTGNTGSISVDEFLVALHARGIHATPNNVYALFSLICDDNTHELSVDMFLHLMYVFETADTINPGSILFHAADLNHTHSIERSELYKILTKLGFGITEADVGRLYDSIAPSGELSYDSFNYVIERIFSHIPQDPAQ